MLSRVTYVCLAATLAAALAISPIACSGGPTGGPTPPGPNAAERMTATFSMGSPTAGTSTRSLSEEKTVGDYTVQLESRAGGYDADARELTGYVKVHNKSGAGHVMWYVEGRVTALTPVVPSPDFTFEVSLIWYRSEFEGAYTPSGSHSPLNGYEFNDGGEAGWNYGTIQPGQASAEKAWVFTAPPLRLAFTSDRDGNYGIFTVNEDGTSLVRLTDPSSYSAYPCWSPDGHRLVFQSTRDGQKEIYVCDDDGANQTRLTFNTASDMYPDWSPDGTRIVFVSSRTGNYQIFSMNTDGSGVARLTNHASNDWSPRWSPDGAHIAFGSYRDGNYEIYRMDSSGANQTRLTHNAAWDCYPDYSPDGSKIVFVSDRDGQYQIYSMNADGSAQCNLSNERWDDEYPDHSPPTANRLVYTCFADWVGGYGFLGALYTMRPDGSDKRWLSESGSGSYSDFYATWAP